MLDTPLVHVHVQLRLALLGIRLSRYHVGSLALLFWLSITEVCMVLNLAIAKMVPNIFALHVFNLQVLSWTIL